MGVALCVDCLGPAATAAVQHSGGPAQPVLFDGHPSLPTGVFVAGDGRRLVGQEALDAAGDGRPGSFVTDPLQLLGSASTGSEVEAESVGHLAAVLRHVYGCAATTTDKAIDVVVLVVPTGWGPRRRTRLRQAAAQAQLPSTDIVDHGTAVLRGAQPSPSVGDQVVVHRRAGDWAETCVLRYAGGRWAGLGDVDSAVTATVDVIRQVRAAAEAAAISPDAVSTIYVQAAVEPAHELVARLGEAGFSAPVRVVGGFDATYGGLATVAAGKPERHPVRQFFAAAVPLTAVPVLLWLLLTTGVARPTGVNAPPLPSQPPTYLYTLWPAWGLIAVLVFLGTVAVTLYLAGRQPAAADPDQRRRRRLASGLRTAAIAAILAGVGTAMLGAATYVTLPVWYLLIWTTTPAAALAAVTAVIVFLVRHGHADADRWQAWLPMPNRALVLVTVGVITIHAYVYAAASDNARLFAVVVPQAVGQYGAIATALAIPALFTTRTTYQIIVSPVVVLAVLATYSYSNLDVLLAVAVLTVIAWWASRIRPAASTV